MNEEQVAESSVQEGQVAEQSVQNTAWVKEDGTFNLEALPDGLGEHSMFKDFKNVEEFVKGAINQNKLIGKKAEEWIMSEDPKISEKRAELLGVPKDASEYQFSLPENVQIEEARLDEARALFKELGIPKSAAEKLIEFDINTSLKAQEAMQAEQQAAYEKAETALKAEWKNDFDYKLSKVQDLMDHIGLSEFKENPAVGNNPEFIKALHDKILPLVSNDEIVEARQTQSLASVEDLLRDVETQINETPQAQLNSPKYRALVQKRAELLEKAISFKK